MEKIPLEPSESSMIEKGIKPVLIPNMSGKSSWDTMDRRAFFKTSFSKIAGFITGLVLAYPVLSFLFHRKITKIKIIFSPEEQGARVTYKEGAFLINKDKELFALSARCTHLGCTLNYDNVSKTFRCPCHGSTFDGSGKYLSGPAKADLKRVPHEKEDNGDILVTLEL